MFLSTYLLVSKPNGFKRFIFNLKHLNKFINDDYFKTEDIQTAIKLLSNKMFVTNLDLQDAYLLISIQKGSRKYLRFSFYGVLGGFHK